MACLRRVAVVAVPAAVAGLHRLRVRQRCRVLPRFLVVRLRLHLQGKAEEAKAELPQEPVREVRRPSI